MPIHILPEQVASQIAAGEVVERPASVIKELVENALDAGARNIRIEVENGGRRLIRIADDGSGIPAAEAPLAFARHATSKLTSIDDLDSLHTLGFRGEALASIAAVAQVTLVTRTAAEPAGTQIHVQGGVVADRRAAGAPPGTVITVESLFYNTPARLKFMKAEVTERRHIDTVVTRYAMAYPNVRFTLAQDGRVTFATTGSGDLADVLVEALGLDVMRDMIEVAPLAPPRPDLPEISVYGYTSAPQLNRNTRSHITLFVNGRAIQDASLTYAVGQAYHTLMPGDRYPVAVLLISLDPSEVDVNVHPTKAEVRFRSPDAVFSAVQRAVRRAVIGAGRVPTASTLPGPSAPVDSETSVAWPPINAPSPGDLSRPSPTPPAQLDLDLADYEAGRHGQHIPYRPASAGERYSGGAVVDTARDATQEPPLEQRPRSLPPMRVVGQVAATYIVAEGPAGLYLVDQHAAHERILYEQFMRDRAAQRHIVQRTLEGVTVQLSPQGARLVEESLETLQAIGFEIEPFGANMIRVGAVPAILADREPSEAVTAALEDLEVGQMPGETTEEAKVILRVCKAAAVKAGQVLSFEEMAALMRQLERCDSPRSCPHGRPTMIHISAAQLAREFGRS